MKTKILLVATLVLVAMTSCKRSYVCQCSNGGFYELVNYTQVDAQAECDDFAEWATNEGAICTLQEK